MSGSQIEFYLTESDHDDLNRMLFAEFDVIPIEARTIGHKIIVRDTTNLINKGEENLKIYLLDRKMVNSVQIIALDAQRGIVDELISDVIEFTRCFVDEKGISKGRMYYISKFYDASGVLIYKRKEFVDLAKSVFLKMKRHLTLNRNRPKIYFGEEALQLYSAGGLRFR